MRGIEDMGSPIAERSVAEVIPGTPLPVHIAFVVDVLLRRGEPVGPIQRGRDRFCREIAVDMLPVPATVLVHEGVDPGNVLDQGRFGPRLELEVIRLRMPLIPHLSGYLVFFLSLHHEGNLPKTLPHRLFTIDMLTKGHREHRDGKMGKIRSADADGFDPPPHLVEHLAEILEPGNIGEHL